MHFTLIDFSSPVYNFYTFMVYNSSLPILKMSFFSNWFYKQGKDEPCNIGHQYPYSIVELDICSLSVLFVLNITIIIHIKMCEKRAIWHKKYSLDLQRIQRFIKPPHWWTHVLHSCWELAKICPHSNNLVINSHIPQETFSKRNFRDHSYG